LQIIDFIEEHSSNPKLIRAVSTQATACFLRNTWLKSFKGACGRGSSSLRVGTRRIM
jgi:hypothetical protein